MLEVERLDQLQSARDRLLSLGMMYQVSGGIQVDLNVGTRTLSDGQLVDAAFCDHNCRIETNGQLTGHYECPASFTLNPGIKASSLAPADVLESGVETVANGIRQFNEQFVTGDAFKRYTNSFNIRDPEKAVIVECLRGKAIEVNCFGGNPELHPHVLPFIRALSGNRINLTTSGGIFMRDSDFVRQMLEVPPTVIAFSADDFKGPEHITALNKLERDELRAHRNKIPAIFGQRRKAVEAVHAAKLAQETPGFPQVLFNLVVHPGNIKYIEEMIDSLRSEFPGILVNPYPAQSSFENKPAIFSQEHLPVLERFIDRRIAEHIDGHEGIVPRLSYWLMLKAAIIQDEAPEAIIERLSGNGTWKCFNQPGADRYVQIGASPHIHTDQRIAGGYLNCFWNSGTIFGGETQLWSGVRPSDVVLYMSEVDAIARQAENLCSGCLMPRLVFDMVSTELGMDGDLIEEYVALRKQTAGF